MSRRVLIVEDDVFFGLDLQFALEDEGYEVIGPFVSCDKALEAMKDTELHYAVLDVDLIGETSAPVARELAEKDIPFAFVTGRERAERFDGRDDAECVLTKPVSPTAIINKAVSVALDAS